jgi:ABC-type uncharacterized transport system permease subunit
MTSILSTAAFVLGLLLYGGATLLFYLEVVQQRGAKGTPIPLGPPTRFDVRNAPLLLAVGALGHAAYVALASFVAHVCPIHSVHFLLSVSVLFSIAVYLTLRRRYRINALGLLVAPMSLVVLLGTYLLGKPAPEPKLSPMFIALHVFANLLGDALFLLAGGAAALYLLQERRIKEKRRGASQLGNLPPLEALDRAVHRFLLAGFPLLTLGILTGTFWAQKLEEGSGEDVTRTILGYATWLLIGGVLLLRAAAGWRGRKAAYGTIAGLICAMAVLLFYLVRPAVGG